MFIDKTTSLLAFNVVFSSDKNSKETTTIDEILLLYYFIIFYRVKYDFLDRSRIGTESINKTQKRKQKMCWVLFSVYSFEFVSANL